MAGNLLVASANDSLAAGVSQWLVPALRQLDVLLERAVPALQKGDRRETGTEMLLPGLCIEAAEVKRLLDRQPGAPFSPEANDGRFLEAITDSPPLCHLQQNFELSSFDLCLLVIALAPEVDLRYERLNGFLQDDVTRRRPSVDLALNLLCTSAEEKLARRNHFSHSSPLISHRLLRILADPNAVQPPQLSHYLAPDDGILRWLLGDRDLDPRLRGFCTLSDPMFDLEALLLAQSTKQALATLALPSDGSGLTLRLHFWGPRGVGKRTAAEALAKRMKSRFLVADLNRCALPDAELLQMPGILCRDARLHDAVLFVRGTESLQSGDRLAHYHGLMDELRSHRGAVILSGTSPSSPPHRGDLNVMSVAFPMPEFPLRQTAWRTVLDAAGIDCADADTSALASRFRLTPGRIAEATGDARSLARWRTAAESGSAHARLMEPATTVVDLFSAARSQCGEELGKLTCKVLPKYTWKDIVLPPDQLAQLREICSQASLRHVVYGDWGFDRKLSLGKGLNILFAGPPGTGKTMAAEVIAKELGLDLYKIDLSQVVSKYIGETEKNLDRIFAAAVASNAILFFDEADALFGKRSEVKDSHDRYANIEIGYLLQKMEEHEGIAVLATNLRQNLDEAFVRRIQHIVEFPFPDAAHRQRIWEVMFPPETPLGEDVDFRSLARAVKLAGGNIKNIAVTAAFYAAADGRVVRLPHIIRACSREHTKLGQTWGGEELSSQEIRRFTKQEDARNDNCFDR